MNARNFFREYILKLQNVYEAEEAIRIAEIAFEHVTGHSRRQMILDRDMTISTGEMASMNVLLKHLLEHQPIQYLTGKAWFYELEFKVNNAVLIPRPETEELVERILHYAKGKVSILDVGTGSGCISVTLKKFLPEAKITSIDISEAALEVARENAAHHQTEITFKKIDFLNPEERNSLEKFDIIVSNPPYIPYSEKETMDKRVAFKEPEHALFAADHLIFYKTLAEFGKQHLNDKMFMEIHQLYAKDVQNIFEQHGYNAVILKDISGNNRMVETTLNR